MLGVNVSLLKWITNKYEETCVVEATRQGVSTAPCFEPKPWGTNSGTLAEQAMVNHVLQSTSGVLVNGQLLPTIRLVANRWYRWRILYAAVDGGLLPSLPGCEVGLIAKDGIYLHDELPRDITTGYLGPGNRADWLVRCSNRAGDKLDDFNRQVLR